MVVVDILREIGMLSFSVLEFSGTEMDIDRDPSLDIEHLSVLLFRKVN